MHQQLRPHKNYLEVPIVEMHIMTVKSKKIVITLVLVALYFLATLRHFLFKSTRLQDQLASTEWQTVDLFS